MRIRPLPSRCPLGGLERISDPIAIAEVTVIAGVTAIASLTAIASVIAIARVTAITRLTAIAGLIVVGAFVASPTTALALNKDVAKSIEQDFNEEMRPLRPEHERLPVTWLEIGGQLFCYTVPTRLNRLGRQGSTFRIDKIKYESTHIEVRFETASEARVDIRVYDTTADDGRKPQLSQILVDEVLPAVLMTVFDFGTDPSPQPITVNQATGLIHRTGCNHLPPKDRRVSFESLADAERDGHRACPICFTDEVPVDLPEYTVVRRAAIEAARLYEIAFPLLADDAAQAEVQRVGDSVVENIPFEGLGFDYRFRIVESTVANAVSFSTGFVYVTSALFQSLEGERELQGVLAHEVAHCELHCREEWKTPHPKDAAQQSVESGPFASRNQECESDVAAIAMLQAANPDHDVLQAMRSAFRKLQFASLEDPDDEADWNSTHHTMSTRLALFRPYAFQRFLTATSYRGENEAGEVLVEIRPVAVTYWPDEPTNPPYYYPSRRHEEPAQLLFYVRLGDAAKAGEGVEGRAILADGKKVHFFQPRYLSQVSPGRCGIQLAGLERYVPPTNVVDFEWKFDGVTEWTTIEPATEP